MKLSKRIAAALKSRISMKDTRGLHSYDDAPRHTSPGLVPQRDRYTGGRYGFASQVQLEAARTTPPSGY